MTNWESLAKIECDLRSAVVSRSYAEVPALLASYGKRLETDLQAGSFQFDQLGDTIKHTTELLAWIFRMVSASKSHDAALLADLLSAAAYRPVEPDRSHSWQLEA